MHYAVEKKATPSLFSWIVFKPANLWKSQKVIQQLNAVLIFLEERKQYSSPKLDRICQFRTWYFGNYICHIKQAHRIGHKKTINMFFCLKIIIQISMHIYVYTHGIIFDDFVNIWSVEMIIFFPPWLKLQTNKLAN